MTTTKYAAYSLLGATLLFAAALTLSVSSASAQTTAVATSSSTNSNVCPMVEGNLWFGMGETNAVTSLQEFLFARGYFKTHVTGPFGPLTRAAVVHFQRDNGIPSTGFVGPLTRAFLTSLCGGTSPSPIPTGAVSINAVNPTAGPVGTSVTLTGSGFTNDNTIRFGSGVLIHVASNNGTTLTFDVPTGLTPQCFYSTPRCYVATMLTTPGNYAVVVQNTNGASNAASFTVTSGTTTNASPVVYKVTPTAGPVGTTVTIDGRGFSKDNYIHFGNGVIAHVGISRTIAIACTTDPSCIGGIHQYLTFTVPDAIGPSCPSGMMCPMWMQKVTPGVYQVSVETDTGSMSNTTPFTVTDGAATSTTPLITAVSPTSASYGTPVTLSGAGFSEGAVLHFYQNGTPFATTGLTVSNDSSASFTVPEWTGVYCPHFAPCVALAKQLPVGAYTIAIETKNGISNQVSFTVGATTSGTLSITGLDAPATLPMGTSGTWTVHASAPSTSGTLHYSVTWGDEAQPNANASIMAPAPHDVQTSTSFTHAYRGAGTYTAIFTVTDDSGHSAQTSSTITVTPWY